MTDPAQQATPENIPAWVAASAQHATGMQDTADAITALRDSITRHVEAAESLQITGEVTGPWIDVRDALAAAVDALVRAAEGATSAAQNAETRLRPLIEAASTAPVEGAATADRMRVA